MTFGHPTQQPFTDEKEPASAAGQPLLPNYQAVPSQVLYHPPVVDVDEHDYRRRRRRRRAGHFFFVTLLLWLVVRHLVRDSVLLKGLLGHRHGDSRVDYEDDFGLDLLPTHPGEDVHECVDATGWTEIDPPDHQRHYDLDVWQRVQLSLPADADDLFFFARGSYAWGTLRVIEAADLDEVGVEVIVAYREQENVFGDSNVCAVHRGSNGHGIGIFTPRFRHPRSERSRLFVNITVSLPEGKDVVTVPSFRTTLPLFSQAVSKLPNHAFDKIVLASTNSPIHVEDLVGKVVVAHSTNGPIEGTFNTSTSLEIHTTNSPVKVDINAFNQNHSTPTDVSVVTTNNVIVADLALWSSFENKTSGAFATSVRTSNSPLDVTFSEHAPDALLNFRAHTTNSPAKVRLHPAFEGAFEARTTRLGVSVTADKKAEDPAGRGRTREVHVNSIGHGLRIVRGSAQWTPQDDELAPAGRADVSTTNGPVQLWL